MPLRYIAIFGMNIFNHCKLELKCQKKCSAVAVTEQFHLFFPPLCSVCHNNLNLFGSIHTVPNEKFNETTEEKKLYLFCWRFCFEFISHFITHHECSPMQISFFYCNVVSFFFFFFFFSCWVKIMWQRAVNVQKRAHKRTPFFDRIHRASLYKISIMAVGWSFCFSKQFK